MPLSARETIKFARLFAEAEASPAVPEHVIREDAEWVRTRSSGSGRTFVTVTRRAKLKNVTPQWVAARVKALSATDFPELVDRACLELAAAGYVVNNMPGG